MPSSTATRHAHVVIGLAMEARRKLWSRSPRVWTAPCRSMTAAATLSTGQSSISRSACTGPARSGEPGGAQHLRHLERKIQALAGIEPRVSDRLVAVVELAVEDLVGATHAFGDVVTGQFDVDAARPCALGL